jgi:GrpB-like predicted nucleotidyltransferase (UPF0157 family)
MPAMIIIINGPLGIGKTSVSWELLYRFERAAMLDGDYLGAIQPFEIYDQERTAYLGQTLVHMAAWHKQHGYPDLVINYVFEQPEALARLRLRLHPLDDEVYAFRLTCAEAEMERRIRRRAGAAGDNPANTAWELQRFRELVAIQEAAAQRGDLGLVVDTSTWSAAQVAEYIWQNLHEAVRLLPYDPAWAAQYESERQQVAAALGDLAAEIHHVGSTAVPGLPAKPVIDLLVALPRLEQAAECIAPLAKLGYSFIDFAQNTDRRSSAKASATHHLHVVELGSASYRDHLDFRDALRADPALRQAYANLKTGLAERYKEERARYSESKGAFITQALRAWRVTPPAW